MLSLSYPITDTIPIESNTQPKPVAPANGLKKETTSNKTPNTLFCEKNKIA